MDLEMACRGGRGKRTRRFHAASAATQYISGALVRDALEKGNPWTTRAFSRRKRLC
jgi:hypothetical protein